PSQTAAIPSPLQTAHPPVARETAPAMPQTGKAALQYPSLQVAQNPPSAAPLLRPCAVSVHDVGQRLLPPPHRVSSVSPPACSELHGRKHQRQTPENSVASPQSQHFADGCPRGLILFRIILD